MPRNNDPTTAYAEAVAAGEILAGRLVKLACERHLLDLKEGRARGLRFDCTAAERAINFFGFLRHSKGEWAGGTFALAPWQQFIVGSIFGWKRADGTRRFRVAYNEIARKNGKSTLSAGVGLYLFAADTEQGAEVYSAATKRDQAIIVHSEAVRMVRALRGSPASDSLRKRIGITKNNLHILAANSKYEPLGADADTLDGLNVHGAIIDELHAHKTRAIVDVLETATGARRQPLQWEITTAGFDRHTICWEHHDYSIKVLEGIFEDDTWFAYIAAIDPCEHGRSDGPHDDCPGGDDWRNPKCWPKANPNLGVSVKLDDLERKRDKAVQVPTAQNAFLQKHLNVWTEQHVRWLPLNDWDACSNAPLDIKSLEGRDCFGGLDLSTKIDLTAFVLLFPPDEDRIWRVLPWYWIPRAGAQKNERTDRVPYAVWEKQGLIEVTDGDVVDYDLVRNRIVDLSERFHILEIGFDPWNAQQIATQLGSDGLTMVEIRQGTATMGEPSKELEALVISHRLDHGQHPILRWNASNITVRKDANENYMPDKAKSSGRIDGLIATIMALSRAIRAPEAQGSVYDTRGIEFIGTPEPGAQKPDQPDQPMTSDEAYEEWRKRELRRRGLDV